MNIKNENQNPIHIRLEYDEAIESRKEILSSEMDFLNISKTIRNYNSIRLRELEIKLGLHKKIRNLITDMRKLQSTLPKLEIPNILKKERIKEKERIGEKISKERKKFGGEDIEYQLKEIQEKLKSISG